MMLLYYLKVIELFDTVFNYSLVFLVKVVYNIYTTSYMVAPFRKNHCQNPPRDGEGHNSVKKRNSVSKSRLIDIPNFNDQKYFK